MLVSVDFGITITDLVIKDDHGRLFFGEQNSVQKPSEDLLKEFIRDCIPLNWQEIELITLTGGHHKLIGNKIDKVPVIHINEVDAIGEGGFFLSKLAHNKPALIVSSGSGTACVLAEKGKFTHCSGTGVGGGTVLGLSKLLLNTSNPNEIGKLAEKGSAKKTDLILEDVVSGPIGFLPSETTAVNFGKIVKSNTNATREDLAAGIVNLVGQTVARIATSVALAYKVEDIIVIGRTPFFTSLRKSLEDAAMLTSFTPHFPQYSESASALGALLVGAKS